MGELQEVIRGFPVQGVHIGVAVIETPLFHFFHTKPQQRVPLRIGNSADPAVIYQQTVLLPRFKCPKQIRIGKINAVFRYAFHHDMAHPVLWMFGDHPARCSAGPAVLVIKPGLHPQLFGVIGTIVDEGKPFFSQIFRRQSGTGVHEKAPEPHFFHVVDLPKQFFFLKLSVPRPKGLRPVLCPRISKFL